MKNAILLACGLILVLLFFWGCPAPIVTNCEAPQVCMEPVTCDECPPACELPKVCAEPVICEECEVCPDPIECPVCPDVPVDTTARLTWNPNTEPDMAGYKVYWGYASGNYTSWEELPGTPTSPSHIIENLHPGQIYFFAVTAYDTSGNESGHSNEVSKQIEEDTTIAMLIEW